MDVRPKRAYEPAVPSEDLRMLTDRIWPRGARGAARAREVTPRLVYRARETEHNDAVVLAESLRRRRCSR
jgi:uncharacterized protein YeaO (DUF488 family)